MESSVSVAAVIVTFNRLGKLKSVLHALQAQTLQPERIFVIDNASTDGTESWLRGCEDPRIKHVRLSENVGGAGGFHEGSKIAFLEGYDLIWLSDDDAYPEPDAIEKLAFALKGLEERTGRRAPFACSMVRWKDGSLCEMNTPGPVWDWPRFYTSETPWVMVKSCSFVSVLVARWAVGLHGLPIKDYFIWYDDVEFTQRISKTHPGILVLNSNVTHDIEENKGVNYGMITDKNLWKFRYGARNETSCRLREQGWWGFIGFVRHVAGQMFRARMPMHLKFTMARAIWSGLFFRPRIEKPSE